MEAIRDIVKDNSWQKVRNNLLGRWKSEPEKCCQELRAWLGPLNKATVSQLRIMMNYLTSSAFRMGKIKHPCIQSLRTEVSMEMKKRKAKNQWS